MNVQHNKRGRWHTRDLLSHSLVLVTLMLGAATAQPQEVEADQVLRVCADANNLPYSNKAGEGFENKLADLLARELDRRVEYTWWPQRRGFIRNTLDAGHCDVVMGVPAAYELVDTTAPYYRSGYVSVTRAADDLDILTLEDPRLRNLRIGVHAVGDDYSNPPPAQILGQLGVRENVQGFSIYGDYSQPSPQRKLIDAVTAGEIDVALVWGPIAGYFAEQQELPLAVNPIRSISSTLPMAFDMAIGVRRDDQALRQTLEEALQARRPDVLQLLQDYGVPLFSKTSSNHDVPVPTHTGAGRGEVAK